MTDAGRARSLVTGGGGFIGAHLVRALLARGERVTVLDDFSTGDRANLGDLRHHPRLSVVEGDVCDVRIPAADRIYHLACPASPVWYQRDPIRTLRTCTVGTLAVLESARSTGATVLLSSTSEVYGDPAVHPQPEDYWGHVNPVGPRACYDEGKRAAEALCFSYHRQHGTAIKVARIFNTYGPGMRADDGRVISNFVVRALAGRALELAGDGSQTRSFCYVDDLVDGLIRLMDSPDEVTGPVNLGNPEEYTIAQLADRVLDLVGGPSRIVHVPLPTDDPARRRPDISTARRVLGWVPHTALDDGLPRTVDHFRRQDPSTRQAKRAG
ncbi:UDP-glucuronate decarboxylase [Friedmanniella endophytica]|uniref:UDP-glucuronate decarboxylase n=1 Tax=Microlunatus kandeliicorticis TaxID=1759536 RepID=A0A7W3P5U2_9ACTN|nr:UDP-glucuronic acid decarboxylase family protein [Microlunatus kandeliicorticis]MBA8794247.1 UDP-glucuronate decarboxylase [Microlunatus kandeliicorticis]